MNDYPMLLNTWSIALFVCAAVVLFFMVVAAKTALRVLRYWDVSSDSAQQIELENEIWLSATLVEFGLCFQIISLLLLVLAADDFSHVLPGAMCATGSLLANGFGMKTLLIKLLAIFLYGFWLVLHRLDISSEHYPLVKTKYIFLLVLLPLLLADISLQLLYLANLKPDIITSCCGILFSTTEGGTNDSLLAIPPMLLVSIFYGQALLLAAYTLYLLKSLPGRELSAITTTPYLLLWLLFYPVSLFFITIHASSYIYAMPFHNCPFDMLRREYHAIGYPIYLTLFGSIFCGISSVIAGWFIRLSDLYVTIRRFQRSALTIAAWLLLLFLLLVSYAPLMYAVHGGEY